jgi:hypothetical protein
MEILFCEPKLIKTKPDDFSLQAGPMSQLYGSASCRILIRRDDAATSPPALYGV